MLQNTFVWHSTGQCAFKQDTSPHAHASGQNLTDTASLGSRKCIAISCRVPSIRRLNTGTTKAHPSSSLNCVQYHDVNCAPHCVREWKQRKCVEAEHFDLPNVTWICTFSKRLDTVSTISMWNNWKMILLMCNEVSESYFPKTPSYPLSKHSVISKEIFRMWFRQSIRAGNRTKEPDNDTNFGSLCSLEEPDNQRNRTGKTFSRSGAYHLTQ